MKKPKLRAKSRVALARTLLVLSLFGVGSVSKAPVQDIVPAKFEAAHSEARKLNIIPEPVVTIKDEIIAAKAEPVVTPPETAPNVPTGHVFTISGYSTSAQEGTADGITADGTHVARGVCAADLRVLPMGTHIIIPGYGDCVIHDTGGAIKGNRIDAYFPSRGEAMNWGMRTLDIQIL